MGLDNYKAMMAVDRFSWESEKDAEARCSTAVRFTIQQAALSDRQIKKTIELGKAYGMRRMNTRVHDEFIAEFAEYAIEDLEDE